MLARPSGEQERPDSGFTLVELLVVIMIIGILAAIAIPSFLNQRRRGYEADMKSAAKNAATAAESAAVATNGDYSAIGLAALQDEGFRFSPNIQPSISTTSDSYCITIRDLRLSGTTYVYSEAVGAPVKNGSC